MQGKTRYLTARIVFGIIEGCGWLLAGIGVVAMVAMPLVLAEGFRYVPPAIRTAIPELRNMPPILGAFPGIGMAVAGLLHVALAQFARAVMDMSIATQRAPAAPAPAEPEAATVPAP